MEDGGGRKGRVTYAKTAKHTQTSCRRAVNHNSVELAKAGRELGRIIFRRGM